MAQLWLTPRCGLFVANETKECLTAAERRLVKKRLRSYLEFALSDEDQSIKDIMERIAQVKTGNRRLDRILMKKIEAELIKRIPTEPKP